MYEATDLDTRDIYRFKTLDTLVRRLGGTGWQAMHTEAFRTPTRQVQVLRYDRKVTASHVVATVIVDTDDFEALTADTDD